MSWLVMSLISCILANTDMFVCYPIVEEISNYQFNDDIVAEATVSEEKKPIKHLWYSDDSYVQEFVNYAYELWWIDFVTMIECENWRWTLDWTSDWWHSHWLCMINDRWHKIPDWFYTDYKIQIDYCYQKFIWWTKFYWPNREVKWVKCKDYVLNRFEINDTKSN